VKGVGRGKPQAAAGAARLRRHADEPFHPADRAGPASDVHARGPARPARRRTDPGRRPRRGRIGRCLARLCLLRRLPARLPARRARRRDALEPAEGRHRPPRPRLRQDARREPAQGAAPGRRPARALGWLRRTHPALPAQPPRLRRADLRRPRVAPRADPRAGAHPRRRPREAGHALQPLRRRLLRRDAARQHGRRPPADALRARRRALRHRRHGRLRERPRQSPAPRTSRSAWASASTAPTTRRASRSRA
jgi:hypothetical protein